MWFSYIHVQYTHRFHSHTHTYIRQIIQFAFKYRNYARRLILIHIHTSDTPFESHTYIYIRHTISFSYSYIPLTHHSILTHIYIITHTIWVSYIYIHQTHHLILILIYTLDKSFDSHTYPPKKLLGSRASTPYTLFRLICTINSKLKYFSRLTHLSELGSISADF